MALQDPNCPIINVSVKFNQENPFKGPSVQGDLPISYPLNNLDQLLEWKPNDPEDHGQLFSVASVPHSPKIISETATKTLMCHDMKGGYLNDRFALNKYLILRNQFSFESMILYKLVHYESSNFFVIFLTCW